MKNICCFIAVLIILYAINFSNLSHDAQLIWLMNNESVDIINLLS